MRTREVESSSLVERLKKEKRKAAEIHAEKVAQAATIQGELDELRQEFEKQSEEVSLPYIFFIRTSSN